MAGAFILFFMPVNSNQLLVTLVILYLILVFVHLQMIWVNLRLNGYWIIVAFVVVVCGLMNTFLNG